MKTIVFAGGGTAGHVMPNLALISELENDYNCVYIGGEGMEKSLCLSRGIPFHTIKTVKFRRDALFKNLAIPFKLTSCVKTAKKVLREIKPQLIFSKGGYAALPVVLAAQDIPVISHESDFSPGLTTKLAKKRSVKMLCSFESCAQLFANGVYCGAPLSRKLYGGKRKPAAYGLSGTRPILTVIGGSSGAASVNECIVSALPFLLKNFDVIHVTGKNKKLTENKPGYCAVEFENDMPTLYATSDAVITRAGANALAECIALKLPTIAIPLEKASRGDQLQNANYFEGKNAVKVLREHEMTPDSLTAAVGELWRDRSAYIAAMQNVPTDGTKRIVEIIKELLKD